MNKNQEVMIKRIREYILQHEMNNIINNLVKFEVIERSAGTSFKYRKIQNWVDINAEIDIENPKNPFLNTRYFIIIGFEGKIVVVKKFRYLGKDIDKTKHWSKMLRRYYNV